jgi:hypothetical protein
VAPSKNDFVSVVQQYHQTAVTLRISAIDQALDLDGISIDRHGEILAGLGFYYGQQRATQLTIMTHALAAGMPRLEKVEFSSRIVRNSTSRHQWVFAISRDGGIKVCSVPAF